MDVRRIPQVESFIAAAMHAFGRIDILVNNAGLARGTDRVDSADEDDWNEMIDTNVKGLLALSRRVAPIMNAQEGGHIINMSSTAGHWTYEGGSVYCGTKFAVRAITETMRLELADHRIRVTAISPGLVETEFSVVRFHGDQQRADNVYANMTPLTPGGYRRVHPVRREPAAAREHRRDDHQAAGSGGHPQGGAPPARAVSDARAVLAADEQEREASAVGLERIVFFSDAVFAIGITLLVLDIHIPERGSVAPADLPAQVLDLWPRVAAYILSFLVVGLFWMAHHRIFHYIRRFDTRLIWLNLLFLMTIAFLPVPTALLAAYGDQPISAMVYAGVVTLAAVMELAFWSYASNGHRLIDPALDPVTIRVTSYRALLTIVVFGASIIVAYFSPFLAELAWTLTLFVRRAVNRLVRRG